MLKQFVHHRIVAVLPAQHGLVEDDGQVQRMVAGKDVLLDKTRLHTSLDDGRGGRAHVLIIREDVPGVLFGLQQPGDYVDLPLQYRRGLGLKADESRVLLGEDAGVLLPPALLGGFVGQGQQLFTALALNAIDIGQTRDVAGLKPAAGQLIPAYLRLGPAEKVSDRLTVCPACSRIRRSSTARWRRGTVGLPEVDALKEGQDEAASDEQLDNGGSDG